MRVDVRVLGGFDVRVDGRLVTHGDLHRKDPARLVKLLAITPGHRLHREQAMDHLWPEVDIATAQNRLHKAAHFVRKATGCPGAVVLRADIVALFPDDEVVVDAAVFDQAATRALQRGDEHDVSDALRSYGGELLPLDPYEDWAFHLRQRLRLRHQELLRFAGDHAALVALDPTDEAAHVELMRAMLDRGDRAGVLAQFDVLAATLEHELGVGPSDEARAVRAVALAGTTPAGHDGPSAPRSATLAEQRVGFCRTADGVRLAYAVSGSGSPLVKASNWLSHLDHDWGSVVWRHWWQELSARHRLVRYDERGCGLSDWDVDRASFTLEAWVHDLETVVDALGIERFPILGISQGGPIAIEYAARHPDRVSHVVVYGTCARSTWARASDERRRQLAALGELIRTSWGSDEPGFRQVYDARFLPDGPIETWRAFDELQRRSTSPRNAQRMWAAFGFLDCAEAARRLDVPTLVLHADQDQVWSVEEAEELHSMVRGSRLVRLPSRNHILQAHEPAFGQLLAELDAFLAT